MGFDGTTPFSTLYAHCAVDDDERAWGELIRRFHPFVGRVVAGTYRVLSPEKWNGEDVEDAAQESWYRLMREGRRHIRSYPDRSEGEFRVYLRTTAANVVRDRLKAESMQKRPRMARLDEETREFLIGLAPDPAPAPDDQVHNQLIAERVEPLLRRAWADRPHLDRDITVCALALMEGLSAQKIASIESIGLSRGGVEKVIERGKKILRAHFAGPGARSSLLGGPGVFGGDPPEPWRDVEEVLAFVLGTLEPSTRDHRLRLLAEDRRARKVLLGVTTALDAPLERPLRTRLERANALEIYRAARARVQLDARGRVLPRWMRGDAARAAWASAAVLLVALGPLLGRLPQTPAPVETPGLEIQIPLSAAEPLRWVQPFSPEAEGPRRSTTEPLDEDKLLAVEESLILERERGADPVATSNALAHLKLARGQLDLAERNYLTALQHDPRSEEARIGLSIVDYRRAQDSGDPRARSQYLERAESRLEGIEPASPQYLQATYNRIHIALMAGNLDRAQQLLTRYEKLSPEDGWVHALRSAVQKASP